MQEFRLNGATIPWEAYMDVRNGVTGLCLTEGELRAVLLQLAAPTGHRELFREVAQEAGLIPSPYERDLSQFQSACPAGFDTIIGWVSKNRYDIIENCGTAAWLHSRDGFWLSNQCKKRQRPILKVEAPKVLRDQGIEQVNAYPIDLIAERFAE
ncbi:MAG: hypothetical protein INH37_13685 [Myxococcaceae bacterium]|nr:hypothetical protein [Myxococcaceae bacterium]